MKKLIVSLSFILAFTNASEAQVPVPPPDLYNDFQRRGFGFWKNPTPGWVVGTDGNVATDVQFVSDGALPRAFIRRDTQISLVLASVDTSLSTPDTLRRLDMSFSGELFQHPDAVAIEEQPGHRNFYFPHCSNGVTGVKAYNRILYKNIYTKIDLWMYCGQRGQKMALVIHPGGNPEDIRLLFSGQNEMDLDILGNLRMLLEDKWVVLPEAVAYQYEPDETILPLNWTADYVPNDNTGQVGFVFDSYDDTKPLVLLIGPPPIGAEEDYEEEGLCWSTYIAGDSHTFIHESATDVNDYFYIAGRTSSSIVAFPQQVGMDYQALGTVCFTTQFDSQDQVLWTTYQGGLVSAWCDTHGLVCNATGTRVYVAGWTNSSNFSIQANGSAYFEPTNSASTKGFIGRLLPATGERLWATYVSSDRTAVEGLAFIYNSVESRVVLTGYSDGTLPAVQDPIPTPPYPYGGNGDAMLVMFNQNDRVCYATYLGGTEYEVAHEIRSRNTGGSSTMVIAGSTYSQALQTAPCPQGTYCYGPTGSLNTFLMEFDFQGVLTWSTYLNTPSCSGVFWDNALALDPVSGDAAIGTYGHDCGIDIVGPGYHGIDPIGAAIGGMLHRFSGVDRSLIWSSYLGQNNNTEAHIRALAFDPAGNLYVAGNMKEPEPPFTYMGGMYNQVVPYPNYEDGDFDWPADPFVMRFAPGNIHDWGTYIGGYAYGTFWEDDGIYTMLGRHNQLYVAGGHAKTPGDEDSYFALDEGDGTPYFSSVHGPGSQGFIAAMCMELSVGTVNGHVGASPTPNLLTGEDGRLSILGLPAGYHQIELVDAVGRTVLSRSVRSMGANSPVDPLIILPIGFSLVRIDGDHALKAVRP